MGSYRATFIIKEAKNPRLLREKGSGFVILHACVILCLVNLYLEIGKLFMRLKTGGLLNLNIEGTCLLKSVFCRL